MKTEKSTPTSLAVQREYSLAVIAKADSENAYGIAAHDTFGDNAVYVKEIGSDKELATSIVGILNDNKVPYVHFIDIINDMMNK